VSATIEALWAQYDSLAYNPIEQSRFALDHRLHESPRPAPAAAPAAAPTADPSEVLPGGLTRAQYAALRESNPVTWARFALAHGLFNK
jgi:hypothetical protein